MQRINFIVGENEIAKKMFLFSLDKFYTQFCIFEDIECGIHYEQYKAMFEAINYSSKQNNVIVFITTHSKEFLEYAVDILNENKDTDFMLFRFEKSQTIELNSEELSRFLFDKIEVR